MLRLALRVVDLPKRWAWSRSQNRLYVGGSWVEAFCHQSLRRRVLVSESLLLIVVHEVSHASTPSDSAGISPNPIECTTEAIHAEWATARLKTADWTALLINRSTRRLSLRSGPKGLAPVYLSESGNCLRGSWDPVDLYPYLQNPCLEYARASHYLACLGQPYAHQTILRGLLRVTPGSLAIWGGDPSVSRADLRIRYPNVDGLPCVRRLLPEASPICPFLQLLTNAVLGSVQPQSNPIATELSGGLDSGIVTAVAARCHPRRIKSHGLVMPSGEGAMQNQRRMEFVKRFQLQDAAISAERYLPFGSRGERLRESTAIPWGDCYDEAFGEMFDTVSRSGSCVLMTGIGGDELMYPHWSELSKQEQSMRRAELFPAASSTPVFLTTEARQAYVETFASMDRAPRAEVPGSGLEDAACVAPSLLRRGIWPVHPLCSAEVYQFCQALPAHWRQDRRIMRQALAAMGCSATVTHPVATETFQPLMSKSLRHARRAFVRSLFEDSRLDRHGLVDGPDLVKGFDRFCSGSEDVPQVQFYAAASMEMVLRAVEARASRDPLALDAVSRNPAHESIELHNPPPHQLDAR